MRYQSAAVLVYIRHGFVGAQPLAVLAEQRITRDGPAPFVYRICIVILRIILADCEVISLFVGVQLARIAEANVGEL